MSLTPARTAAVLAAVAAVTTARPALAVQGGAVDRTTTHAVAIGTGPDTGGMLLCSGTLVSPHVVLTVRHCVSPVTSSRCPGAFGPPTRAPTDLWIETAPYVSPPTARRRVSSWTLPKGDAVCGADVALLVLADAVPAADATPAAPVTSAATFADATASTVFGLAGFGASGASDDSGLRRSRFDLRRECVVGDARFPCAAGALVGEGELTSLDGACPGDSGAGAMRAGDPRSVFAILSRGELQDGCGRGIFVRTDRWAWLIGRTTIDATPAGEDAPSWARDLFPRPATPGAFCRSDGDCAAGASCISRDGERSFACVVRCTTDEGCADGEACQAGLCTARPRPSRGDERGCRLSSGGPDLAAGVAALVVLALLRRARDRRVA